MASAELIDAEGSLLISLRKTPPNGIVVSGWALPGWQIWRMDPLVIHSSLRYTGFVLNEMVGWATDHGSIEGSEECDTQSLSR